MLQTYKAKLHGDRIIWEEDAPDSIDKNSEVEVFVTIFADGTEAKTRRPVGLAKGEFVVPEDFDAPLPDEVLADFEN